MLLKAETGPLSPWLTSLCSGITGRRVQALGPTNVTDMAANNSRGTVTTGTSRGERGTKTGEGGRKKKET